MYASTGQHRRSGTRPPFHNPGAENQDLTVRDSRELHQALGPPWDKSIHARAMTHTDGPISHADQTSGAVFVVAEKQTSNSRHWVSMSYVLESQPGLRYRRLPLKHGPCRIDHGAHKFRLIEIRTNPAASARPSAQRLPQRRC